jgi:hypothetical protein
MACLEVKLLDTTEADVAILADDLIPRRGGRVFLCWFFVRCWVWKEFWEGEVWRESKVGLIFKSFIFLIFRGFLACMAHIC